MSQIEDSIHSCFESAIINDCISRSKTNQMLHFSDARSSPVRCTLRLQTKGLAHQLSLLVLQCQHSLFHGIRHNVLKIKKVQGLNVKYNTKALILVALFDFGILQTATDNNPTVRCWIYLRCLIGLFWYESTQHEESINFIIITLSGVVVHFPG